MSVTLRYSDVRTHVRSFTVVVCKQSCIKNCFYGLMFLFSSFNTGMVIRCSSIIPDLKQAFFRCFVCSHSVDVLIDRGEWFDHVVIVVVIVMLCDMRTRTF